MSNMSLQGCTVDTSSYMFAMTMSVRDYELDYQGIVNNANYLHYLEHTRHEFCRERGMTFAAMHERGLDPVLSRITVDYKHPLRSDDAFVSCLSMRRAGPKFEFVQDLFHLDGRPVLHAIVTIACLENGRLSRGDTLAEAFGL